MQPRAARKARGQKGAGARWGIPQAEHVGEVDIGGMLFPCSVLSDGTRILTQTDFMSGMGMYYSGWVARSKAKNESSADTPHFLAFKSLEPFIYQHLGDLQSIVVKVPGLKAGACSWLTPAPTGVGVAALLCAV